MKIIFVILLVVLFFMLGCGKCKKKNLNKTEIEWVNHFKKGQRFLYRNLREQTDTLEVVDTSNYYTPCNKFELSEYQYEIYLVRFIIKSKNNYNNREAHVSITTEEWLKRIPYLFFCNIGSYDNDLKNKMPIAIDTVLNKIKFDSVYYYSKGLNVEQYGKNEYMKNFFWSKKKGLMAYTTLTNEVFIRIE